MIVSEITLFNTLRVKLGEQDAQTVVEGIKQATREEFENKKDTLATKQDISELRIEMERGFKDNLKWTIATMFVVAGIMIAAIKVL